MLIFLYGTDSYRLKEAAEDIVSKYKKKYSSGFNFFSVDCHAEGAVTRIADISKETSFFDEVKLVRIKNIGKQASELEEIISKYNLLNDKAITLLITDENNKSLFKNINAPQVLVRKFEPQTGKKLENWIINNCQEKGAPITIDAVRALVRMRGEDSWALSQEINKLVAYCRSRTIKASDVAKLVTTEQGINIFEFTDAVAGQDKAKTFSLLHKALVTGQEPGYILAMIVYQFRNLLSVVDLVGRSISAPDIAKKTGLHPFVVKKIFSAARNLQSEKLTLNYRALLDIDTNFKKGQIDLVDSLYQFSLTC